MSRAPSTPTGANRPLGAIWPGESPFSDLVLTRAKTQVVPGDLL